MRLTTEAMHALAGEYVLGTLQGRARRRFEALARDDAQMRAVLAQWEAGLTPLAEGVAEVEPPARVWRRIEQRIGGARVAGENAWKSLAMLATGFAAALLVVFVWLGPRSPDPELVAVLTASDSVPRMVVALHGPRELRVHVVKPWTNVEGRSLELWALPANGVPRSIGLVENERDTRIRLDPSDARLHAANAFAVSLEPRGGSPTGKPTGAVLCSGVIAPYRAARKAA